MEKSKEQKPQQKSRLPIFIAVGLVAFIVYQYYLKGIESNQEAEQMVATQAHFADMEKDAADRKVADSLDLVRMNSISKVALVDEVLNGCSYKVFYYQLKRKVRDSTAVDFMASKLLDRSYASFETSADCQQKKYVRINLYQPGEPVTLGDSKNAVATYEMGAGFGYSPYINSKQLK